MRLFEALTIAFAGQVALAVAIMAAARPRWMNLLSLAPLVPLAAHLLLEGPRWHMVPAYVAVLAGAGLGVRRWRKGSGTTSAQGEERRQLLSRMAALAGIVLLAGSVALGVRLSGR